RVSEGPRCGVEAIRVEDAPRRDEQSMRVPGQNPNEQVKVRAYPLNARAEICRVVAEMQRERPKRPQREPRGQCADDEELPAQPRRARRCGTAHKRASLRECGPISSSVRHPIWAMTRSISWRRMSIARSAPARPPAATP